jgi:hypothetical protein
MKAARSGLIAAAALVSASFFATPVAAMPLAKPSELSRATAIQDVGYRCRHSRCWRHYYYAPLYVGPDLVYGCRHGWYCFGPDWYGRYRPAWYGGFTRYGYQGRRYRPG